MKYLESVSLAFHSEVGQGYVLKEGGVFYSPFTDCSSGAVLFQHLHLPQYHSSVVDVEGAGGGHKSL